MEGYKRALCWYFNKSTFEEEIYDSIKDDPKYTCNLNEDGLLHSNYTGTHYEPAIIYRLMGSVTYYWLFNGNIKDCEHPFMIKVLEDKIIDILYYSSERIKTNQYINCGRKYKGYNIYYDSRTSISHKIVNSHKYYEEEDVEQFSKDMFTPEWYPLFDEMETHFKFAD